jgi:uncharacterized protein YggE
MVKIKLAIILILFILQTNFSQQNSIPLKQITVQGSVEINQKADQASFSFSIKGTGETLRQAVENAENKTKLLIDKLIQLGIKKNNISTSSFFSGENYGDKAFLSSSRDFKAIIETIIKIDSLELIKSTLFTISDAEVENISKISFSIKDELGLRRRARIEAGLKAKEKAEDLASSLGVVIGDVIYIEEIGSTQTYQNSGQDIFIRGSGNYPNPFNPSFNTLNMQNKISIIDETKGSGFFAQTVNATSQVKVTFAIK